MTQTNEELREKIHNLLGEHNIVFSQNFIDDLYALIPQPEQLEVEIVALTKYQNNSRDNFFLMFKNSEFEHSGYFKTKQEALDFCKRFNLKVINEVSND